MTPINEEGYAMKKWLILSLAVALLGGCIVVPVGERYHDNDRYYQNDLRNHDYRHYG
jgi:hypothetical protein